MLKKNHQIDTFNSGVLQICIKENKRIKENLINGNLRYKDETLGFTRFYNARVSDTTISKVVSIPYQSVLKNEDRNKYAIFINNQWYDIDMIQNKFDSFIPKCILTLIKGGINYTDERT